LPYPDLNMKFLPYSTNEARHSYQFEITTMACGEMSKEHIVCISYGFIWILFTFKKAHVVKTLPKSKKLNYI